MINSFTHLASNKNIFISNSGNNNNSGINESYPVLPSYLNGYTFGAGERVYFKKGETFIFDFKIVLNANYIQIDSYGSGDMPILKQTEDISGLSWNDEGGGVYSVTTNKPDWVWLNGSPMKLSETDWIEALSRPAADQIGINHSDVSGYSDISGSIIIYKSRRWRVSKYLVQSYNGAGIITCEKDISGDFQADKGLKLAGKVDYFDGFNEWAHEGGKLYIKVASSPSGLDIKRNTETDFIQITGDNCSIKNLEICEYFRHGIIGNNANGLIINSCKIHSSRVCAISLDGGIEENCTITNNEIYNIGYNGIFTNVVRVPNIQNNTIYDIGKQDNYGYCEDIEIGYESGNSGIVLHCDNDQLIRYSNGGLVQYNNIYNIAYCGIKIRGQNNNIKYNYIHDCMERFGDGGGIYSFGGNVNAAVINATGNTYQYNIIKDCLGSEDGLFAAAPDGDSKGIYMDNECIYNEINLNVIENCPVGILTNRNTKGHTIENNIIVKCEFRQIEFNSGLSIDTFPINHENIFNNNILACGVSTAYCLFTELSESDPDYNPYDNGGEADENYYIQPYASDIVYDANAGGRTLAELKTLYGEDVNSTEKVNFIAPPGTPATDLILYTNPTNSAVNQLIPSGYEDIDGIDVGGQTIQIPAYYGYLIIKS